MSGPTITYGESLTCVACMAEVTTTYDGKCARCHKEKREPITWKRWVEQVEQERKEKVT